MSPDRGWKKAERMIAADCGGRRIPVTGERAGSDVDHELFAFQLKVRRSLPAWLFDWLGGIVANAKARNRIGVLVVNRPRQPRRNALVIVRWSDWCALHGTPNHSDVPDIRPDDGTGMSEDEKAWLG